MKTANPMNLQNHPGHINANQPRPRTNELQDSELERILTNPIRKVWEFWAFYGCFLKWWYPQNIPKWSFLVGKPMGLLGKPTI